MSDRYSEVLDAQQAMRRWMSNPWAVEGLKARAAALAQEPEARGLPFAQFLQNPKLNAAFEGVAGTAAELLAGEPYWVAPEICTLLMHAAKDLPEWTSTPDLFPTQRGFLWLGKPYSYTSRDGYDSRGNPVPVDATLHGFGWARRVIGQDESGNYVAGDLRDTGVKSNGKMCTVLSFFTSSRWSRGNPEPAGISILPDGTTLEQVTQHTEGIESWQVADRDNYLFKIRLLGATLLFLNQRILMQSNRPADRATRRRVEHYHNGHVPEVRAIILRRADYGKHASDYGHKTVDWSWQWMVRGHWRQQFYRSEGVHRPKWIMPHWKGPEDAPVKPVKPSLIVVTR